MCAAFPVIGSHARIARIAGSVLTVDPAPVPCAQPSSWQGALGKSLSSFVCILNIQVIQDLGRSSDTDLGVLRLEIR